MRWRKVLSLLLACALLLPACGASQKEEEENSGKLIYAALNPLTPYLKESIESYNKSNPETQIEVRDYSDDAGTKRLMTELMLGNVPDIIEMQRLGYYRSSIFVPWVHCAFDPGHTEALWRDTPFDADTSDLFYMPYRSLVQRGYLEDLWPYIENDPEFGREKIVEGPLKAAEVNGGLYMLPKSVSVNTLAGPKSVVGDRCGWTLKELTEAFAAMPGGSTVLRYDTTRNEVFFNILAPLLDQFIDWGTGECSFDCQEFRDMLDFLALFPSQFNTWLRSDELEKEIVWQRLDGLQMLEPTLISSVGNKKRLDAEFDQEVAYVGYPTADGSSGSSFIFHGPILAMSSVCRDKEAAWDFMRRLLRAESKSVGWMADAATYYWTAIPLNKVAYNAFVMGGMDPTATAYLEFYPGAPLVRVGNPTEEDRQRFEDLVNGTTLLYWPDERISDAVWDAIGPYFAGDRSLDDTVALVQNRVTLYVNEQR